jgi:hypothetical protein
MNLAKSATGSSSWLHNQSINHTIPQLTTIQAHTLQSLNGMVGAFGSDNLPFDVKRYEVFESPVDVLALSVTWKRLRDEGRYVASKVLDHELFKEVSNDDRTKANEIRDYYSKKIVMWNLKEVRMSQFRRDLNDFVHNQEGKVVRESMLPLAATLPNFYSYDCELDTIRNQVTINQKGKELAISGTHLLKPIKCIHKKTKRTNTLQYWFKDVATDGAFVIPIDPKNSLGHIWKQIFENSSTVQIKGIRLHKQTDDFQYFMLSDNWELVT